MAKCQLPDNGAEIIQHPSAHLGARRLGMNGALTATAHLQTGLQALASQLRSFGDALAARDSQLGDIAQNCAEHLAFQTACLDALALRDIDAMARRRDELLQRFRRMHG